MTDLAAFKGTVGALRTIGGRKVIAVTIEVPIEHQQTVAKIAEHGAWVAVARLAEGEAPAPTEKPKRSWNELSVGEQAGIRCGEESFWTFLGDQGWATIWPNCPSEAAGMLRSHFGVASRKDIPRNEWNAFEADYQHWLRT